MKRVAPSWDKEGLVFTKVPADGTEQHGRYGKIRKSTWFSRSIYILDSNGKKVELNRGSVIDYIQANAPDEKMDKGYWWLFGFFSSHNDEAIRRIFKEAVRIQQMLKEDGAATKLDYRKLQISDLKDNNFTLRFDKDTPFEGSHYHLALGVDQPQIQWVKFDQIFTQLEELSKKAVNQTEVRDILSSVEQLAQAAEEGNESQHQRLEELLAKIQVHHDTYYIKHMTQDNNELFFSEDFAITDLTEDKLKRLKEDGLIAHFEKIETSPYWKVYKTSEAMLQDPKPQHCFWWYSYISSSDQPSMIKAYPGLEEVLTELKNEGISFQKKDDVFIISFSS